MSDVYLKGCKTSEDCNYCHLTKLANAIICSVKTFGAAPYDDWEMSSHLQTFTYSVLKVAIVFAHLTQLKRNAKITLKKLK